MNQEASVCIIGAGCSGLTSIKNMLQAGITDVVCYEKNDQIGGNWVFTAGESHSSVCETTHIISSKTMSEFSDFPMPEHYPDYPSHKQVLDYFRAYADHFQLHPYIQLNTVVRSARLNEEGKWEIMLENGEERTFDYLLVANGHHSVPRLPELPGQFDGELIHSHSYKTNVPFADKRVLVIGAGNSGCDCAVEISRVAQRVSISMRRPYYIIPKFMMGRPTDTFNSLMTLIPPRIRNFFLRFSLKLQIGKYEQYGLQNPDYPVTACHPTLNSELLYKIRHGKVQPQKGIVQVEGKKVTFADGHSEVFDVIIAATGYKIRFPFFDKDFIDFEDEERISLYLRMIHPKYQQLFFIGLLQPQGCIWPLSEMQAKLAGNLISGRWQLPNNVERLAEQESAEIAKEFLHTKRHAIEVHYHPFLRKLKRLVPKDAPNWADRKVVSEV